MKSRFDEKAGVVNQGRFVAVISPTEQFFDAKIGKLLAF